MQEWDPGSLPFRYFRFAFFNILHTWNRIFHQNILYRVKGVGKRYPTVDWFARNVLIWCINLHLMFFSHPSCLHDDETDDLRKEISCSFSSIVYFFLLELLMIILPLEFPLSFYHLVLFHLKVRNTRKGILYFLPFCEVLPSSLVIICSSSGCMEWLCLLHPSSRFSCTSLFLMSVTWRKIDHIPLYFPIQNSKLNCSIR